MDWSIIHFSSHARSAARIFESRLPPPLLELATTVEAAVLELATEATVATVATVHGSSTIVAVLELTSVVDARGTVARGWEGGKMN